MHLLVLTMLFILSACNEQISLKKNLISGGSGAPVATNLTPTSGSPNSESIITLVYTHPNPATSCSVNNLNNLTISTPCSCDGAGVCTVGVTGGSVGSVSFDYSVVVDGVTSNTATASFTLVIAPFTTIWKTDNPGTSTSTQITLPLVSGASYNFTVDWGDGTQDTITAWNDAAKTHTYLVAGTYTVRMTGVFERFYFNNGGDRHKILEVSQWGPNQWTSMEYAFAGCTNLQVTATDAPDLSNVTSVLRMFFGATNFNSPIGHWDVSNVQNFYGMFQLTAFNQPIGNWDMSSATNIGGMFGSTPFNQNINDWDVSNVTMFASLFSGNSAFNQPLDNWDLTSADTLNSMFSWATSFNQDIGGWDTSTVTNMTDMFMGASSFNQDIGGWETGNVTSMFGMFRNSAFNQDISTWDVSNVTTMSVMFEESHFNQDISSWDVSNVTVMEGMFRNNTAFNQDLSSWDVTGVTSHTDFATGASAWVLPQPNF